MTDDEARTDNAARCPHCRSTSIQAVKRGITFSTGLLGAGDVEIVCLACGGKSYPGQYARREASYRENVKNEEEKLARMTPEQRAIYESPEWGRKAARYREIGAWCAILGMFSGCAGCIKVGRMMPGGYEQIGVLVILGGPASC